MLHSGGYNRLNLKKYFLSYNHIENHEERGQFNLSISKYLQLHYGTFF
jgi:hypothetical protein